MRVNQSTRDSSSYTINPQQKEQGLSSKVDKMAKTEIIADIFNNRPQEKGKDKDTKVRLSHTVKALWYDFNESVKTFLKQEKGVSKALEEIPLPDTEYTNLSKDSDLTLRRLTVYAQWLQIHEGSKGSEEEIPTPFKHVYDQGKNEEIKALFETYNTRHEALVANRTKNIPNYYYLAFPSTYSFN